MGRFGPWALPALLVAIPFAIAAVVLTLKLFRKPEVSANEREALRSPGIQRTIDRAAANMKALQSEFVVSLLVILALMAALWYGTCGEIR